MSPKAQRIVAVDLHLASASGELALAVGLRHPDVYGAIFWPHRAGVTGAWCNNAQLGSATYLVAGTLEPFFLKNAVRWPDVLRGFPLMMARAFGQ